MSGEDWDWTDEGGEDESGYTMILKGYDADGTALIKVEGQPNTFYDPADPQNVEYMRYEIGKMFGQKRTVGSRVLGMLINHNPPEKVYRFKDAVRN